MQTNRESLNIVVVGHVDHGKSTLIGRLLFDTDALPEGAIEKVKKLSKEKGKAFEYAYLLDAFEEEQLQGITIDTTQLQFATMKRDYVIIDAPGHKEFLKNMVSGAASAEVAFLMVDAQEGIQEQSRRHGYILSLLGIKKVYVVVNKMDLVDYSQERFEEIETVFNAFLHNLGVFPRQYIPISAYFGENLVKKTDKMPWYKGASILDTMDLIEKDKGLEEKPLRFPVQDVYKFDHRRIIVGRIESGTLHVGDEIHIAPSNKVTRVKSIEYFSERDKKASISSGYSVGITVEDEFFNKRGEIICHKENVVKSGNIINASLFWLGKNPLERDKRYKIKLATQEVECELFAINKVIDASTLEVLDDTTVIKRNDVAEVTIKTKTVICFDEFSKFQNTGRFVLVDELNVAGGGIITGIDDSLAGRELKTNSAHIIPRKRLVGRNDRETLVGQKGLVIWLTGLPGCGKNEIALKLEKKLFDLGKRTYYLDSSNLRFGLSSDLAFTEGDAHEQTRRIAEVANLFADSGTITIVTSVNRFKHDREVAQEIIGKKHYIEIFVEASEEVCRKRAHRVNVDSLNEPLTYEKSNYPVVTLFIDDAKFNSDLYTESIVELLDQF